MNTFLILIFLFLSAYIGSVLSKIFVINSSKSIHNAVLKHNFLTFLTLPFSYRLFKVPNLKDNKKLFFSEFMLIVFNLIFTVAFIVKINNQAFFETGVIIEFVYYFFILTFLEYLSIFDIFNFSIYLDAVVKALAIIIVLNLIALFASILNQATGFQNVYEVLELGKITNVLGGLIGFLLIFLLVKLTDEKGMGSGDIYIATFLGIILGPIFIVYNLIITFVGGSFFGVIYSLAKGKFHGLLIPFVPILSFGFLLTVSLVIFNNLRFIGI